MWERFTYYGMRAVLILFLSGAMGSGGLGLDDRTASAIYGLYISATYVFSLLGGWIADRLVGSQRAIIAGAVLIIAGNLLLSLGLTRAFFAGLLVIVIGVGLLKPNISTSVGRLYPEGGARRDAGFSIFYVGISVGAVLGPLLVSECVDRYGWHAAFRLPAFGMTIGLGYFLLTRSRLADPPTPISNRRRDWWGLGAILLLIAIGAALPLEGIVEFDPLVVGALASWLLTFLAALYFFCLAVFGGLTRPQRHRLYVSMVLFAAYALFYAGFEQGGDSMNLFADRYVDRSVLGWTFPAGILQSATALYTILFAPAFAALWLALGKRGKDPSPPAKFGTGLLLLSFGTLLMVFACQRVVHGHTVTPLWLLTVYLLQELGDLCLSPVGLSSMTKLAPQRYAGQMMGVWFLALALGNNLAGQLSTLYDASHLATLPALFLKIFVFTLGAALVVFALTPLLKRLMQGPEPQ